MWVEGYVVLWFRSHPSQNKFLLIFDRGPGQKEEAALFFFFLKISQTKRKNILKNITYLGLYKESIQYENH